MDSLHLMVNNHVSTAIIIVALLALWESVHQLRRHIRGEEVTNKDVAIRLGLLLFAALGVEYAAYTTLRHFDIIKLSPVVLIIVMSSTVFALIYCLVCTLLRRKEDQRIREEHREKREQPEDW